MVPHRSTRPVATKKRTSPVKGCPIERARPVSASRLRSLAPPRPSGGGRGERRSLARVHGSRRVRGLRDSVGGLCPPPMPCGRRPHILRHPLTWDARLLVATGRVDPWVRRVALPVRESRRLVRPAVWNCPCRRDGFTTRPQTNRLRNGNSNHAGNPQAAQDISIRCCNSSSAVMVRWCSSWVQM